MECLLCPMEGPRPAALRLRPAASASVAADATAEEEDHISRLQDHDELCDAADTFVPEPAMTVAQMAEQLNAQLPAASVASLAPLVAHACSMCPQIPWDVTVVIGH